MEYTHLGRSGLSVSRLCLGTMNFGWKTPEDDAHAILDRAQAEGVNFVDTANTYGFDAGKGRTEEVLGTWFAQGGQRREKTVLATKVYGSMTEWPNDTFLSARNLVRSCEASLCRLQTDWIDLYQFHHVDPATPWDEIWQACETLVAQGKVLYVGSSNHAAWQLAAANEAAARRHFLGLVSEQSHYNLLTRHVELEVLPAARHYGVGIVPWSPLAGGLLAGVLGEGSGERRRAAGERVERHRPALQAYEDACREWGLPPADVGVAWLLHQPVVTAPIVGPRTMEQLEGALGALAVSLDDDQLARLDEIWPGYREAPMEYAW
ncbi:aldo/keto reductase [Geodermatophilus sabuli]|uniref:Aldo/keto reductase n=1 Tax=Geodermatophilus sabuli TaxID=1564158 RepID=A0A7K3W008_9ACTN|nr:aldo/keto reductase [Geodermatophilus sabuli]NEK57673.1 aldo/keto reductase [Geodermatophilus sabuli]